jgi:predicted phosphodiesterase
MKLMLFSDLHLEFRDWQDWWDAPPIPPDVDVVVLAGDIAKHCDGLAWAADWARREPVSPVVLYVAGNHEYYGASLGLLSRFKEPSWGKKGVQYCERRTVVVGDTRFLACTLWSGFSLHGPNTIEDRMAVAKRDIADYWLIRRQDDKRLTPDDTRKIHKVSVRWLDNELSKPFDGKTVVVTHFAPHPGCVAAKFQGSEVSPYFVTDLGWLMQKHRIHAWAYGHTHTNISFVAENGCRVISNQRCYPREEAGSGFDPNLIIEI